MPYTKLRNADAADYAEGTDFLWHAGNPYPRNPQIRQMRDADKGANLDYSHYSQNALRSKLVVQAEVIVGIYHLTPRDKKNFIGLKVSYLSVRVSTSKRLNRILSMRLICARR